MEAGNFIWRWFYRLLVGFGLFPWISARIFGPRITAVAGVTIKAAFRFRLFPAMLFLLMLAVVVLPLMIKDDGSAEGLTQILLTYTLGAMTALLGFSTLWLGCGVLARDIEDCTIQTLAVKPVARWEIWTGKWLGIMALNAMLLLATAFSVYSLVLHRANRLADDEKEKLQRDILVGRGSLKREMPDLQPQIDRLLAERLKDNTIAAMDRELVRKNVEEMVKAGEQVIPPGMGKRWEVDFGPLKDWANTRPMQIRLKFHPGQLTQVTTFPVRLWVGPPDTAQVQDIKVMLTVDTFHDVPINTGLIGPDGKLTITFYNYNPMALLVPLEDGIEVLYRECGFGLNFLRGMLIIFLWLGILAALGLAAASYLSFPVAAFFSVSLLLVTLSGGIMETVVKEGTVTGVDHETGLAAGSVVDYVLLPVFRGLLWVIHLVEGFSPVESLSSGRSVSWGQLGRAFLQIGVVMTGLIALAGIGLFNRRELATAQQTT